MGESKRQIFDKVLVSLADGYETIASLMGEGTDEEYQLKLPRTALIEALTELIKSGHVKAVVFNQEAKKYEASELSDAADDHVLLLGLAKKGEEHLAGQRR